MMRFENLRTRGFVVIPSFLSEADVEACRADFIPIVKPRKDKSKSFRAGNSNTLVRRARLADGGMKKASMMANNAAACERMFLAFDAAGRDEMPTAPPARVWSARFRRRAPAPASV